MLAPGFDFASPTDCAYRKKLLSARSFLARVAGFRSRIEAKVFPYIDRRDCGRRELFAERFGEPLGEGPGVAEVSARLQRSLRSRRGGCGSLQAQQIAPKKG